MGSLATDSSCWRVDPSRSWWSEPATLPSRCLRHGGQGTSFEYLFKSLTQFRQYAWCWNVDSFFSFVIWCNYWILFRFLLTFWPKILDSTPVFNRSQTVVCLASFSFLKYPKYPRRFGQAAPALYVQTWVRIEQNCLKFRSSPDPPTVWCGVKCRDRRSG